MLRMEGISHKAFWNTFRAQVTCVCSGPLEGFFRQGLKCSECHQNFHSECLLNYPKCSNLAPAHVQPDDQHKASPKLHSFAPTSYVNGQDCVVCGQSLPPISAAECSQCRVQAHTVCATLLTNEQSCTGPIQSARPLNDVASSDLEEAPKPKPRPRPPSSLPRNQTPTTAELPAANPDPVKPIQPAKQIMHMDSHTSMHENVPEASRGGLHETSPLHPPLELPSRPPPRPPKKTNMMLPAGEVRALQALSLASNDLTRAPFFHEVLGASQDERRLYIERLFENTTDGTWLLRISHKKYVISVRYQEKTWHLIIEQTPTGQYYIGQVAFQSVAELLVYYHEHTLSELLSTRLEYPVLNSGFG